MQIEIARFTDRVEETVAFYSAVLGREPDIAHDGMAIFFIGNVKLFIHHSGDADPDGPPNDDHIAFSFDDVDAAVKAVGEKGLSFELAPHDYYWGRSAYLRDPDGRLVEISSSGE